MQSNNRPFSPANPQRPGGILPPLSKYYYGPAVSPERSPANVADAGWNAPNPQQGAPALPPRPPNSASAPPISQYSSHHDGLPQQSKLPGPPPTAPSGHPVAQSSYNPNTYGPMPGARQSPINPTWNQSSHSVVNADTSKWGIHFNQFNAPNPQSESKPPLPPRAPSCQSQHHGSSPDSEAQHSQGNGSFEYLRPVAYSPVPSPSTLQGFTPPNDEQSQDTSPQPGALRLPPPPPGKIPSHNERNQGQEPNDLPSQAHGHRDSIQSSRQFMSSEVHVDDDEYSDRHASAGAPSVATAGSCGRNDFPGTEQSVDARESNVNHEIEQVVQNADEGSNPYNQDRHYESVSQAKRQAQHGQRPPETFHRHDSITPSSHDETRATNSGNNQTHGDDSFYWHSPHSSASTSRDRDQNQDVPGTSSLLDATPEPLDKYVAAPPASQEPINTFEQTINLYQSANGPYGASALGFGGPSDWEHFGDYDGEEVDDTDLYIRPKSPIKPQAPTDTSELPGDTASADITPVDVQPEQHPTMQEETNVASSEVQPISYEPDPPSEPQTYEIPHGDTPKQYLEESSSDLAQPTATYLQAPKLSATAAVGYSAEQQPLSNRTPRTYLPQFLSEQKEQDQMLSEDAANGNHIDCQSALIESAINARPSSLTKQHTDESNVGAAGMEPGVSAVVNNESVAETTKELPESQAHDEVQPSPNEQFDAQSERDDRSQRINGEPAVEGNEYSREDSSKRGSVLSNGSVLSKIKELGDPYAELDPWGKASLNRYVAMLHEEARATTEQGKLNMFKVFIRKEWKLRAILYGADDEQADDFPLTSKDTPVSRTNTLPFRRPASKALPALPPDADQSKAERIQPKSLVSPKMHTPSFASLMTTKDEGKAPRSSGEESYVIIDTPSGQKQQYSAEETFESYSPGGRPVQPQPRNASKPITSSGLDAQSSRTDTSLSNASEEQPPDKKPAYTPFRYSQGYVDDVDQPVDRRASFRPYAALKLEPIEHQLGSTPEPVTETSDHLPTSADDRQVAGAASSSRSQTNPEHNSADARLQPSSKSEHRPSLDLRRFERADFDPMIAVLPQCGHIPNNAIELSDFQNGINAVLDDFSFIHQHVVAWDTKAKKIRADNERERQTRQGESEQRIDALFNDDEIGYGDIPGLESEFKRAEATRKTEEDRAEYHTFVEEVFNAVWARLHFEIDQLGPLYEQYAGLAHETLAGKDMFEATQGQYALAPTMSALLTLHQKLEIRHQKAFEAVLERDRRLKKIEVAPFYTLGNVSKVKQLEKQFLSAERRAIAEYCKQKSARSNRLMDVLDQNTLRGVGANQDYMEAVMKAVRRIASGRAFASVPASEPGLGLDEVVRAKTVTAVLAGSSEQIVQTFHVADMLLNAADYELSVATARIADADPIRLERLKDERAKEDAKLMRHLQHRLALIREDSRRTNDEIVKLLCFLGVQGGHAQAGDVPKSPPIADPEHEQRLQKALEDAKRRNAQKAAGDSLP